MHLISLDPELADMHQGHFFNFQNCLTNSLKGSATVTVLANARFTSRKKTNHIPWFSNNRHLDTNATLFQHEVYEWLDQEKNLHQYTTVFCYSGDFARLGAFFHLANKFTNIRFVMNVLWMIGNESLTFFGSQKQFPQNLLITSESKNALLRLRTIFSCQNVKLLPSVDILPQASTNADFVSSTKSNSYELIISISGNRSRGSRLALKSAKRLLAKDKNARVIVLMQDKAVCLPKNLRIKLSGLSQNPRVFRSKEALSNEKLHELLERADLILLPYNPDQFQHQASGLFISALLRDVVPIVPQSTWMADEIMELQGSPAWIFSNNSDLSPEKLSSLASPNAKKELFPSSLGQRAKMKYDTEKLGRFFLEINSS